MNAGLAYIRSVGGYGSARKRSYKGKVPNRRSQGEILQALMGAIQRGQTSYQQQ